MTEKKKYSPAAEALLSEYRSLMGSLEADALCRRLAIVRELAGMLGLPLERTFELGRSLQPTIEHWFKAAQSARLDREMTAAKIEDNEDRRKRGLPTYGV